MQHKRCTYIRLYNELDLMWDGLIQRLLSLKMDPRHNQISGGRAHGGVQPPVNLIAW